MKQLLSKEKSKKIENKNYTKQNISLVHTRATCSPVNSSTSSSTLTTEPGYSLARTREINDLTRIQAQQSGGTSNQENIVYHITLRDNRFPGESRTLGEEPRNIIEDYNPSHPSPRIVTDIFNTENNVYNNTLLQYSVHRFNAGFVREGGNTTIPVFPNNFQEITNPERGDDFVNSVVSQFLYQNRDGGRLTEAQTRLENTFSVGISEIRQNLRNQEESTLSILEQLRNSRRNATNVALRNEGENIPLLSEPLSTFLSLFSPSTLGYIFNWIEEHPMPGLAYLFVLLHPMLLGFMNVVFSASNNVGDIITFMRRTIRTLLTNPSHFNIYTNAERLRSWSIRTNERFSTIAREARARGVVIRSNMYRYLFRSNLVSGAFGVLGAGAVFVGGFYFFSNPNFVAYILPAFRSLVTFIIRERITSTGSSTSGDVVTQFVTRAASVSLVTSVINYLNTSISPETIERLTEMLPNLMEEMEFLMYQ